jgi:ElaB/YqjD/DUF883 family membrane-anchored ribosome-binding protein
MSKHNHDKRGGSDTATVAEDARALLAATAGVHEEKVEEARDRLAAALGTAKEAVLRVRDKAVERAKAADQAVRERPYHALVISLGIGALFGYIIGRRRDRD